MSELPARVGHPATSPLNALRQGVRQRQLSSGGQQAWRRLRLAAAFTALSLLATALLPGALRNLVGGGLAVAAAVLVARLLGLPDRWRGFWRWSLIVSAALLLVPWGPVTVTGRTFLSIFAGALLIFRPYRFLPLLGSARRALTWLAGLVLLVAFIAVRGPAEAGNPLTEALHHVHGAARFVLATFWAMCVVGIFLGVRLHFMKLRPKLAVAGLLLAAVPVGLVLTLGALGAWSLLGAGRAEQASATLEDWRLLTGSGDLTGRGPFAGGFGEGMAAEGADARPGWADDVADAVAHAAFDPMPDAAWFVHGGELWALRIDTGGGSPRLVGGRRLGRGGLERIARDTGCVVGIYGEGDTSFSLSSGSGASADAALVGREVFADAGDSTRLLLGWPAFIPDAQLRGEISPPWSDRLVWFGGAPFAGWKLGERGLASDEFMVGLRTRPRDVLGHFAAGENELNQVVVAALAAIAFVFLLLQLFAFYFGMRIVGGVTSAVGQLHRMTERLARGDLDARISLPNEDEFGDLADSFNEMTSAIRLAQDQIVQKELLEAQLDTARQIQQRLLPAGMPRLDGYQISGSSDPSLQVGGDYFDFVEMPDGRLGIAVADVTGKGIPASLLMANVQAGLHGQALHPGTAAGMIGRMNDLLYESTDAHMFVTFALVVLDPVTGELESVSAGHEPTLLVRPDGSYEKLEAGGLMLGMMPGFEYSEARSRLEPGEVLVMYTDGVTEAMGPQVPAPLAIGPEADSLKDVQPPVDVEETDEEPDLPFFEEERLIEVCVARRHDSADEIRRALLAAVRRFARDVPQSDDITIVVIKREAA